MNPVCVSRGALVLNGVVGLAVLFNVGGCGACSCPAIADATVPAGDATVFTDDGGTDATPINGTDSGSDSETACAGGSDTWCAIATEGAPAARSHAVAVWTGSEMLVWGGVGELGDPLFTGSRYDAITDDWTPMAMLDVPPGWDPAWDPWPRGTWSGSEMLFWGGQDVLTGLPQTGRGARYQPAGDSWTVITTQGAPCARFDHAVVWTGEEMIVWGGSSGSLLCGVPGTPGLDSGSRYDPLTDAWTPTTTLGAPSARRNHTAVWTGSEMIVWGGYVDLGATDLYFDTGGRYDPMTDTWTPTSTVGAPSARATHTAVWTGTEMIIRGGGTGWADLPSSGGRYDPTSDTWLPPTTIGAPEGRAGGHSAVWTGTEMIVWGGMSPEAPAFYLANGGRYDPALDAWAATAMPDAPSPRASHSAVWTGAEMIVWGGVTDDPMGSLMQLNDGGRYYP